MSDLTEMAGRTLEAGAEAIAQGAATLEGPALTAAAHAQLPVLQQTLILLAVGALILPVCRRLRFSPVIGYLLAGLLLGPAGLVVLAPDFAPFRWITINSTETVHLLAELGIAFLLFMIGLELSPQKLWQLRRYVFGLGGLQIALCGASVGLLAAWWGNSAAASILLGGSLAFSSTAIVMQVLAGQRRMGTTVGRASFAVLLMQDLAVVPMLILLTLFSAGGDTGLVALIGSALGRTVVVLGLIYLLGRWLLRPLLRFAAVTEGNEAFLASALLAVVGTAALTGAAGLSMSLGAFLAGLLLAESEYSTALEVYLEPFKGLLLGLFFFSIGMGLDVRMAADLGGQLLLAVGGLTLVKGVLIYGLARLFGLRNRRAMEVALLLAGAGEFAFVIINGASTAALIPEKIAQFMLLVTGASMICTPVLASVARRLAVGMRQPKASPDDHDIPGEHYGHVIIAGFGRVGRLLADVLRAENVPYLAIESNGEVALAARAAGHEVFIGNASHPDFLEKAGAGNAQSIVLTMSDPAAVTLALTALKAAHPHLIVYARAPDFKAAARLMNLGATDVTPETTEASLQLAARILRGTGREDEVIDRRLILQRLRLKEQLDEAVEEQAPASA